MANNEENKSYITCNGLYATNLCDYEMFMDRNSIFNFENLKTGELFQINGGVDFINFINNNRLYNTTSMNDPFFGNELSSKLYNNCINKEKLLEEYLLLTRIESVEKLYYKKLIKTIKFTNILLMLYICNYNFKEEAINDNQFLEFLIKQYIYTLKDYLIESSSENNSSQSFPETIGNVDYRSFLSKRICDIYMTYTEYLNELYNLRMYTSDLKEIELIMDQSNDTLTQIEQIGEDNLKNVEQTMKDIIVELLATCYESDDNINLLKNKVIKNNK